MKLTQKVVDALKPGERRRIPDDDLKGLRLRVSENSIAWEVDFRIGAKRVQRSLGSTGEIQLAEARDLALQIRANARKGLDVSANPREGMPTFAAVWKGMIEEVDRPKLAKATVADYEDRAQRLILPKIGGKLIGDVTPADVDKIVAATSGERNRGYVVVLIKKTINHAIRALILPADHRNPAVGQKSKRATKAGRALEIEEIQAFGKALADMETEGKISPWLANLFRLSLVCGLRPGEVRTLTWERVNIPRRKMIVQGKTGAREIDLTDAAVEILSATPRIQGNAYVFAGRRHGEPVVAVHKMLNAIRARAGIEHFRPYDFRHTAATGALATGADIRAVQALLGHADLKTTAVYLHANAKRRRAAAESAAAFSRGVLKRD